MKRLVTGILAHVDSGKTTLSEAMLYRAGALRRLGRVDHGDAFLDTDALERARGITIFSKQAVLSLPETELTLLDTPGHVDFSAEAERALQVMDCALLVISGTDGVQSHTETLWHLLERYGVPTFIFVNKMDLPGSEREKRMAELSSRLGAGCVDMLAPGSSEELALCSEELLESALAGAAPADEAVARAVWRRELFPVYFGSALRLEGVDELLDALRRYTLPPEAPDEFGARIFKLGRDAAGVPLAWLKVTGGELRVKAPLASRPDARRAWQGKADQIRVYSGEKYELVSAALPGMICAVTGLEGCYAGEGLGAEPDAAAPALEPVLRYRAILPAGTDAHTALNCLRELEREDPMLRVDWDSDLGAIFVQLMGEVQLEVLQSLMERRFGLNISFDEGGILYRETVRRRYEGVGHYEPLRHYAEVHLIIEPGERGSGIELASVCPTDELAANWQRLILTHLAEKTHLGVLTGSPLTDVKISLASGRAHPKHTEGGDFRQATYRAVRQGLRRAAAAGDCELLEPWYDFTLRVPAESLGRALADMQRLSARFDAPETDGAEALIRGRAPVSEMRGYARSLAAYTKGAGSISCVPGGYESCHNAAAVIDSLGYDPAADTANSADSVFCSHGAGVLVPWDEVEAHMHLPAVLGRAERLERAAAESAQAARRAGAYREYLASDRELMAIFERTYGSVRRDRAAAMRPVKRAPADGARPRTQSPREPAGPEHLLVDGYNVIFAWPELREIAADSMEAARRRLMDILCNYAGYTRCVPILVFDAYRVKGAQREIEQYHNIYVVYTKEAETADMYIEKTTHEIARRVRTRVVTSDTTEQLIILGQGAIRVSSESFETEVKMVEEEIRRYLLSFE